MSLHDVLAALRKHLVAELAVVVLVMASAILYACVRQPVYESSTRTYISFSDEQPADGAGQAGSRYLPTDYVNQQLQLIPALVTTPAVLDGAAETTGVPRETLAKHVSAYVSDSYFVIIAATDHDARRAADIANAVADSLSAQLADAGRDDGNLYIPAHLRLSVVDRAEAAGKPKSPNIRAVALIGALSAMALAFCTGVVLELSDGKARQITDIQRLLNAPVLGVIPRSGAFSGSCPVIRNLPSSAQAESVRRLAVNLTFVTPDRTALSNALVVASCGAGEGKTTIAVELAAAFAEQGSSVLLVGSDLRHPSVARRLGVEEHVGLSHLLVGKVDAATAVQRYWKPDFHVLPAGGRVANPSILINSRSMHDFLERACATYDWVVLDTEPLAVANDAAVFAKAGGRLLFVAAQGIVAKSQLRDVARELGAIDVQPVGVVQNFAAVPKAAQKAYGSYYGSGADDREAAR